MRFGPTLLALLAGVLLGGAPAGPATRPATRAVSVAPASPGDNLDYWLGQAGSAPSTRPSQPASRPAVGGGVNPFTGQSAEVFSRRDALPGAVRLSDGRVVAGGLYTTEEKDWEVWVEAEQRWRHVPLVAVMGIRAVVLSEELEQEYRWKEMGSDEKLFTGRSRPIRRVDWRLTLADGSTIEGEIKGQPLWVDKGDQRTLLVLHSRSHGEYGQTLSDLVYPAHVVVSRRAMIEAGERRP